MEPESEFIIKIHDINDNEPIFTKEVYTATVPEMSDVGKWDVIQLFPLVHQLNQESYEWNLLNWMNLDATF